MGEINYYSYSDGYYGATSATFVITLLVIVSLIVAAVLALVIAYQVSILRAINRIKAPPSTAPRITASPGSSPAL